MVGLVVDRGRCMGETNNLGVEFSQTGLSVVVED